MAEVAPAPAVAPAKTAKKKTTKPRKPGSSVSELIVKAVAASKERNGVSAAALKKNLAAGGYDVDKNKSRVKTAIKNLVAKGTLVQTRGTGASGSFKMSKKVTEPKPKKSVKKAAPKVKKAAAKKPVAAKKPKAAAAVKKPVAAKKSPKKALKKSTPVKKTAKSPKKTSKAPSPKKVARKAPPAKKSAAKKATKPKVKKAAPKKK